jgi:hypothetical protein
MKARPQGSRGLQIERKLAVIFLLGDNYELIQEEESFHPAFGSRFTREKSRLLRKVSIVYGVQFTAGKRVPRNVKTLYYTVELGLTPARN